MSDEIRVRKMGHTVQVEIDDDGTPLCGCIMCRGERRRMISTGPGEWACPDWQPIQDILDRKLAELEPPFLGAAFRYDADGTDTDRSSDE